MTTSDDEDIIEESERSVVTWLVLVECIIWCSRAQPNTALSRMIPLVLSSSTVALFCSNLAR